jgi:hypothetical protein
MSWIAVGAAALAAVGTYYNNEQVAQKQDRNLAGQLRLESQKQQQADQLTSQLIAKTAGSNAQGAKTGALDQYLQTIQQNRGNALNPLHQVGATSDAYKASGANAALGITDYGAHAADLMSSIDAPTIQRAQEAANSVRFNSDLGGIKRASAGDDFLAQMRLRNIKLNPWITAGSSIAGGYARGAAGGGSSGTDYGYGTGTGTGGSTVVNDGYTTNLPY